MTWKSVKLSEVSEVIAGQSPESTYYNNTGDGLPFLQGKADFGDHYPTVRSYTTKTTKKAVLNDILLSVRAPVGPTNICTINCCIGRGLAAIRAGEKVDYRYLYFYFKKIEKHLEAQGTGSTFKAITTGVVKDISIPLPPIHIQQQIADTLDKADALRRKDQELLQKYDDLAQSIFYDMFGDPIRNEKEWLVRPFGSMIKTIRYGTGSPPKYSNTGIPFIRATNIKDGRIKEKGMVFLSNAEAETIQKCYVNAGDLLLVRSGVNTGDCAQVSAQYHRCLAGYDLIIEVDEPYSSFYNFLINSRWGKTIIKPLSRRAAQPHLNADQVKSLEFIAPPEKQMLMFEEQLRILAKKRELLEATLSKSQELFKTTLAFCFR